MARSNWQSGKDGTRDRNWQVRDAAADTVLPRGVSN